MEFSFSIAGSKKSNCWGSLSREARGTLLNGFGITGSNKSFTHFIVYVRTRRIGVRKKGKHNAEAQRRGGFSEKRTERERRWYTLGLTETQRSESVAKLWG
jgi:hypothetical protein